MKNIKRSEMMMDLQKKGFRGIQKRPPDMVGKRFSIKEMLGQGSFGCIYAAVDKEEEEKEVAIKFESIKAKSQQLFGEFDKYEQFRIRYLTYQSFIKDEKYINHENVVVSNHKRIRKKHNSSTSTAPTNEKFFDKEKMKKMMKFYHQKEAEPIGIPRVYWRGIEKKWNVLVMDRLGPSLEDLFNFCGRKFSLKTILMLMDQLLSRIQFIHLFSYIHRDIKPENFLFGMKRKAHVVYIVDFGLAMKYIDEHTGEHIEKKRNRSLTGTARYTSINSHLGKEQSRRDDLESLGYLLIYFFNGKLPWQNIKANTKAEKYNAIRDKKIKLRDKLCKGCPFEFAEYFEYVRMLEFTEEPDYDHLRKLFLNCMFRHGYSYDYKFDWLKLKRPIFTNDDVDNFADDVFNSLKSTEFDSDRSV